MKMKHCATVTTLALLLLSSSACAGSQTVEPTPVVAVDTAERDHAISMAQTLYMSLKAAGMEASFSAGPCISEKLIDGWVVDIAHNPRDPDDDKPINQCAAYLDGRAKHFVELDPEGNLIRAE